MVFLAALLFKSLVKIEIYPPPEVANPGNP